jgi:hypothetical protein
MFGFETGLDFFEVGGSYQTATANWKNAVLWIRIRIQHFTSMRIHGDPYSDPNQALPQPKV